MLRRSPAYRADDDEADEVHEREETVDADDEDN